MWCLPLAAAPGADEGDGKQLTVGVGLGYSSRRCPMTTGEANKPCCASAEWRSGPVKLDAGCLTRRPQPFADGQTAHRGMKGIVCPRIGRTSPERIGGRQLHHLPLEYTPDGPGFPLHQQRYQPPFVVMMAIPVFSGHGGHLLCLFLPDGNLVCRRLGQPAQSLGTGKGKSFGILRFQGRRQRYPFTLMAFACLPPVKTGTTSSRPQAGADQPGFFISTSGVTSLSCPHKVSC